MCHERWMRPATRREERLESELRDLLGDERPRLQPPEPVVENERDEESRDPKPVGVEARHTLLAHERPVLFGCSRSRA